MTLVLAITAMFAITASAEGVTEATITFDNTSKRTTCTTEQQIWEENGITVTNNKGSGSDIAEYYNPVRFYKDTELIIKAPGNITEMVITCSSSSYATVMQTSIGSSATASGSTVTVPLDGTSTTLIIANMSAQARVKRITITYVEPEQSDTPACSHENTETKTTPASCETDGSAVVTCLDCGEEVSSETIHATGHNYVDGVCANDNCGKEEPVGYELVTDVTTLKVGDNIVIVANKYDMALGTEQASNNRKAVEIKKADGVVTFDENVEVITLEAGTKSETFAFKVNGGYLYAASSESNYLRTETTLSDNSSWTIAIADGIATIKAQGTNTRNLMQYNNSSKIFAAYGSDQQAISIYKMPAEEPEQPENPDCQHTNTTTTTNHAKCESDGSTVVTCNDCGKEMSRELIPATGHINTTTTTVDPTCTSKGTVTVTCDDCGETVSTEQIKKTPHAYVNGACKDCGEAEPKSLAGKYVIMAKRTSETTYRYIQGEANGSRYALIDSGLETLPASNDGSDSSLIFTLIKNDDGTYKIYVEGKSKYLGWSSGNSGDFVDEAEAEDVTIDESDNGLFNIYFTASDGERFLSLNNTATNNYAAWYKSGQIKDLALIPVVESQPEEPECTHEAKLESANVNLGKSLAVKYYVSLCDHVDAASYTMQFTMNGVTTSPVSCEAEKYNGYTVFVFGGIAPQCMGDSFTAQLLCDGNEVATHTYSILANFENLLADPDNADNAALKQVIYDALAYGAAAQQYVGYKTDALVNDGYENGATTDATKPVDAHILAEPAIGAVATFKSAGVEFGDLNRIYVKIKDVADVNAVKVKVGETVLEAVATSEEGVYAYYSEGISALNLDTPVNFVLCDADGNILQTLTYSVNDYISRKWDDDNMMNLVRALYNYGVSAKAYAAAN